MAHPTPRADALRQMREAKFEAEQKRLKQETGKPAETPKRKPETPADAGEEKTASKPVAVKKTAPKVAKGAEIKPAETAGKAGATSDAAPAAKAKKTAAKKVAAKKASAK